MKKKMIMDGMLSIIKEKEVEKKKILMKIIIIINDIESEKKDKINEDKNENIKKQDNEKEINKMENYLVGYFSIHILKILLIIDYFII